MRMLLRLCQWRDRGLHILLLRLSSAGCLVNHIVSIIGLNLAILALRLSDDGFFNCYMKETRGRIRSRSSLYCLWTSRFVTL